MKVPWNENVLGRTNRLIFVIAVITPIGLSGPSFAKPIFEARDGLSPKRIERPRWCVRAENQNRAIRAGKVGTQVQGKVLPRRPVRGEIAIMRQIGISRELLHE